MVDNVNTVPKVAIIIINWNAYHLTADCLNSLRGIDYQNYKVILVDNFSSDDSANQLKVEFPEIHLIQNDDNLGFTGGNNKGLAYALVQDFEYVLLLNNDTFVEPNFLSVLIRHLESDQTIGAIQPKIYFNHNRQLVWSAGGRYNPLISKSIPIGEGVLDEGQFEKMHETDWLTGCAFLTRTSVIQKVGVLSDIYFYGCFDDVDWSLRIKKLGYKLVFCPESRIYHAVAASSKSSENGQEGKLKPYFHYLVNRNHIFLLRRHAPWYFKPTSYLYQLYKFIGYSTYFILKRRFKKLKAFQHGFLHGLIKPLKPDLLNHKHYINLYK